MRDRIVQAMGRLLHREFAMAAAPSANAPPGSMSLDHADLREKLSWNGPPSSGDRFLSIFMDQNNKCNLKCQMCGFSDSRVAAISKYDMPRSLFETIARQVFPLTNYLCLSIMTEPFMTRDFPDRLQVVRELGVPYSDLITNGTLLTDEKIAKILDAQITRLIFSIDGGTKEVFETIRLGARFEKVIENFLLVGQMKRERNAALPILRINHVLSEPNIDHFDDFLRLAENLAPAEIAVRTVSRMSDAIIQESSDPVFWQKVRTAREKLVAFCKRTGIADSAYLRDRPTLIELFTERGERMICRRPWDTLAIHPNGDVYPCMAWMREPLGNFQRETFAEMWRGSTLDALRREFEEVRPGVDCLHCVIRKKSPSEPDDFFYQKVAKPFRAVGPDSAA